MKMTQRKSGCCDHVTRVLLILCVCVLRGGVLGDLLWEVGQLLGRAGQ